MSPSVTTLEFHSGVVRFDASFNLFVVLTHSPDDPQPVLLDEKEGTEAPGRERRGRVVGATPEGEGTITGVFPVSNDLPRGLVIEIRNYKSAELREDGALVVTCSSCTEVPEWFGDANNVLFRRDAERLRVWAKSSFRDGFSGDEMAQPATPAEPKKKSSSKNKSPKSEDKKPLKNEGKEDNVSSKATGEDSSAPAEAEPKADEPYRPERMPAGSYTSSRLNKGGNKLGCSTLLILGGLCVLSALAMLG